VTGRCQWGSGAIAVHMRAAWWLVLLPWLAGCPPTFERLRLRVGLRPPTVDGVTWTEAWWQGRAIRMRPCLSDTDSLGWPVLPPDVDWVPADPDPAPFTIGLDERLGMLPPLGHGRAFAADYCALDLISRGVVTMVGEGPGGPVSVAIDLPDFESTGFADTPHGAEPEDDRQPEAILIRLGGDALSTVIAVAAAAGPVAVTPDSPEHATWQALLVQDVGAYIDRDRDLALSDADALWLPLTVVVPE